MAFIKTKPSPVRPDDLINALRLRYGFNDQEEQKTPGILAKPAQPASDSEVIAAGFFNDMLTKSQERAAQVRAEAMEQYARESAEEAAKLREIMGISRSKVPQRDMTASEEFDATVPAPESEPLIEADTLKPEQAAKEGLMSVDTSSATQTMKETIEDVLETIIDSDDTVSTDSADGGAATEGKGLMSPRLDKGDEILPPPSAFIKNKDTTAGDTERELYKDAYQAGLSGDELKAFMAQVAHESSSFGRIEERGYSWSKNYNDMPQAWKDRLKRDGVTAKNATAERIFNSVYANRNGNGDYASGDGNRYRGRGYIQLTGKDNYRTIGNDIGEDLVGNPDLMLNPDIARKASIAWWKRNVRGSVPDDDYTNINAVSGLVNRGDATLTASGLDDRKKKFARYTEAVTNRATSPRPMLRPDEEEE